MTQAQRTQTSANGLVPAAVAGLVMVAALAGAILVYGLPTMSLTPGTGTTTVSEARIKAEDAWMQQRIQQSAAFDVMSAANRQSADQWEAMQRVLAVSTAARSSTFTEAERQAILRHQMLEPEGTTSALDAARKLQIERQVQSGAGTSLLDEARKLQIERQLASAYGAGAFSEPISGPSLLDEARKLQIERQVQSGVVTREFTGQRKGGDATDPWSDSDVRTPTHPQLR